MTAMPTSTNTVSFDVALILSTGMSAIVKKNLPAKKKKKTPRGTCGLRGAQGNRQIQNLQQQIQNQQDRQQTQQQQHLQVLHNQHIRVMQQWQQIKQQQRHQHQRQLLQDLQCLQTYSICQTVGHSIGNYGKIYDKIQKLARTPRRTTTRTLQGQNNGPEI